MAPLTRRQALRLGGTAFAGGVAGCSTFGEQSSPTLRLGKLDVHNYDRRPHTLHVVFLDDGNPVYWVSKTVPDGDESEPGYARLENYPTEPGDYVLHVRADDQPKSRWGRFDFGTYDTSCVGLFITIGDPTIPSPGKVSIWHSTNENECKGMATTTEQ